MPPRTVLRIIDRLNVGGPALHAAVTARGLDTTRYRTVLVIGSVEPGEADMGDLLDGADCEIVRIPSLGRELRPARDIATARALYDVIRRVRPEVVHTHKAKAGALGRTVALLARVPVRVHTFHGHVFRGYFSPGKTQMFLGIERALARSSTKLIALSDKLVDELAGEYRIAPRDQLAGRTARPGRSSAFRPPAAAARRAPRRARAAEGASASWASKSGRMGAGEGPRDLPARRRARRYARHQRRLRRHRRRRARGRGARAKWARSRCPRCQRPSAPGWRRDLEALYPDLDVVALSSVNEGTPVTLIEAMSAGVPVAATEVGGVADVLEGGARGELASAGDAQSLAEAILRALEPAAQQRALGLRAIIAEQFGAARLCRDLEALYDRLLAAR